ncbi:hypothetical protein [uncultured Bradyrhizobium sp.]|uniref:hypothetical protein n=1 Tax=uncultured Bradyrhizobium sp. TaxID=199684 RepID=UPI0035CB2316
MADEAFALSPISARAAQPGEADYDAIRDAFMETSRGRWFLSEYAKRNRNADTRMVLDAVARIEANIAIESKAAPENGLTEALAVIRNAVDEARAAASAALGYAAVEASLAPIRNGARVIRETLCRLREIGADGRIYDLIDFEASAIEKGCSHLASSDTEAALGAAFALIDRRLRDLSGDDAAQSSVLAPPETKAFSSEIAKDEAPVATANPAPSSGSADAGMDMETAGPPEYIVASVRAETAAAGVETAHDDAVLDLIALEMAAPDFDEPELAETETMATIPVSSAVAQQTEVELEPSLGAALIASGIVRRSEIPADPLGPIRRMSQAEKIAFFS